MSLEKIVETCHGCRAHGQRQKREEEKTNKKKGEKRRVSPQIGGALGMVECVSSRNRLRIARRSRIPEGATGRKGKP